MEGAPHRPFTAIVRFPGKLPVMFGTFFAPAGAKDHEKDALVVEAVTEFVGKYLPDGTPVPAIEKTMWGAVVFMHEDEK